MRSRLRLLSRLALGAAWLCAIGSGCAATVDIDGDEGFGLVTSALWVNYRSEPRAGPDVDWLAFSTLPAFCNTLQKSAADSAVLRERWAAEQDSLAEQDLDQVERLERDCELRRNFAEAGAAIDRTVQPDGSASGRVSTSALPPDLDEAVEVEIGGSPSFSLAYSRVETDLWGPYTDQAFDCAAWAASERPQILDFGPTEEEFHEGLDYRFLSGGTLRLRRTEDERIEASVSDGRLAREDRDDIGTFEMDGTFRLCSILGEDAQPRFPR